MEEKKKKPYQSGSLMSGQRASPQQPPNMYYQPPSYPSVNPYYQAQPQNFSYTQMQPSYATNSHYGPPQNYAPQPQVQPQSQQQDGYHAVPFNYDNINPQKRGFTFATLGNAAPTYQKQTPSIIPPSTYRQPTFQPQQQPQNRVIPSFVQQKSTSMISSAAASWPKSLTDFVDRVFASTRTDKEKQLAEKYVEGVIQRAQKQNALFTTDWTNAPLLSFSRTSTDAFPTTTFESAKKRPAPETKEEPVKKKFKFALQAKQPIEPVKHNEASAIVGTCTVIEKPYFRLNMAPDPSTVRPEPILKKALSMVKSKHKNNSAEYNYICEQLKSIRQDLTVQRIMNEFTVKVYETHARIALQHGDLSEFNQCQTRLKELYQQGIKGHVFEFTAYLVLYQVFTKSFTNLTRLLQELPSAVRKHAFVQHAVDVYTAIVTNNYYKLFNVLHKNAPKSGARLMDIFEKDLRKKAMKMLIKSHSPMSLPLDFVKKSLGFTSDQQLMQLIIEMKIVLTQDRTGIDCKQSVQIV